MRSVQLALGARSPVAGLRQSQMCFFSLFFFLLYERLSTPDWAREKTLAKSIERQFGGPNPVDPDKIFPEFFTCNLEKIFNTKKSKWDRRSRCGRDYVYKVYSTVVHSS